MSASGKKDDALLKIVAREKPNAGDLFSTSGKSSSRKLKAILKSRPSAGIGAEKWQGMMDLNFQSFIIRFTQSLTCNTEHRVSKSKTTAFRVRPKML